MSGDLAGVVVAVVVDVVGNPPELLIFWDVKVFFIMLITFCLVLIKEITTVYVGYKANKEIFADFGLITEICLIAKFGGLISDEIIREIAIFLLALELKIGLISEIGLISGWPYIRRRLYVSLIVRLGSS